MGNPFPSLLGYAYGFTLLYVLGSHGYPNLGILVLFLCICLHPVLWVITWWCINTVRRIVILLIRIVLAVLFIPKYVRYLYIRFWHQWTIRPRRFGWQTLRNFPDARTPLLLETECSSHACDTTSKLCPECFDIIERSGLISGSTTLFARRLEWYKWTIPCRRAEPSATRKSCQLCSILWNSLDEQSRSTLTAFSSTSPDALWLWLAIWQDQPSRWFDNGGYYIQLFDRGEQPENRTKLCRPIHVREELLEDSPPSVHIPTYTGSAACLKLVESWITDCQATHITHCSGDINQDTQTFIPTRLLFVGDRISSLLRLEDASIPSSHGADVKYIALNYCHNENVPTTHQKLTLDKKDEWKHHMNEKGLPLAFQHAIHLTRQLELNYLWIDSLCIIQDSPEDRDHESRNLGNIYSNAYCTISADSAADANGSCFVERPSCLLDFPCRLRFSNKKALTIRSERHTYTSKSFSAKVDRSMLSRSACSLPGRFLSRRTVHFGSRYIFFECNTHIASEVITKGRPFRKQRGFIEKLRHFILRPRDKKYQLNSAAFPSTFNPITGYCASLNELMRGQTTILSVEEELRLHRLWFQLVSKFTRSQTSERSDRIVAIQSLAQEVQSSGDSNEFMKGLWRRHLLFDLLWYIESGQTKKPAERHAPSWSWQAVEGEVSQRLISHEKITEGKKRSLLKVAEVIASNESEITAGVLSLKCPLFVVTNVACTAQHLFILEIQTSEGRVEARLAPDILDFSPSEELFCAEIIREVVFEDVKKRDIFAVWSNGIVLRRKYTESLEGVKVTYERVGRFWMEWPLVKDELDPRSRSIAKFLLQRREGHVIRIE